MIYRNIFTRVYNETDYHRSQFYPRCVHLGCPKTKLPTQFPQSIQALWHLTSSITCKFSPITYKQLMGTALSGQQLQRLKHERIDRLHLLKMVRNVKTEEDIQIAIKLFLSIMTLKQKLGQLQQWSYGQETLSPALIKHIADGGIGGFLNVFKLQNINLMQKIAMEQSRLKIPLIVARDVIHGYKTIFPIPLAQAASFNPDLLQQASRVAAIQASADGIKWTFTPMVDIARDPRWGRIAEGFGEDPYLSGVMGAAVVRGLHGKDIKDKTAVLACGKHLVGYGASEGGKDYNTCYIPEGSLRDNYLPPFKVLHQTGCLSYMTAFTDLNGEPCAANDFILKQIMREQWRFDGVIVSDYTAVTEMINQGFVQNQRDAARRAFNGGLDIEMTSTSFYYHLEDLLHKKLVSMSDLNTKVARVLRLKFRMNLFQNYYTDPSRQSIILDPKHKEMAKKQAIQCPVLLQNNHNVLPIRKNVKTLAVIGKLADDPQSQIGCWAPDSNPKDSVTALTSLKETLTSSNIIYAQGYQKTRSMDTSLIAEAVAVAKQADVVLLFLGEDNWLSGESNNRAYINLPGIQEELVKQIAKTKKPIAAVIYAGRSLLLQPILPYVDSVLYAWHLGTMAGPALTELLIGNVSPSGKSPVTFPRHAGQIPIYYNYKFTGRPNETKEYIPYTVGYIDVDQTHLFPFGYGLSYTTFSYTNLKLSKTVIAFGQSMVASATVTNQGQVQADEIVFLFVRDLVGSYTRPSKELKDFQRVPLSPGESKTVSFVINSDKLRFWTKDKEFKAEPGKFHLWIGRNAQDGLQTTFELLPTEAEYETL